MFHFKTKKKHLDKRDNGPVHYLVLTVKNMMIKDLN